MAELMDGPAILCAGTPGTCEALGMVEVNGVWVEYDPDSTSAWH